MNNPRSLVGMTMSARKLAARVLPSDGSGLSRREILRAWHAEAKRDGCAPGGYFPARAAYRIGERLRPCRGCAILGTLVYVETRDHCDGSGVLPAKGAA